MRFTPVVRLPTAWSGVHRHFAVHLFHGRVTVEEMDRLESIGTDWRRRNPGRVVELVVIHPSDVQMTSDERTRMTQLIKRWEQDRIASATVILADGIVGSLQRSVLTGMTMIVPPPHPAKVFGAVGPAVEWLTPHVSALWRAPASAAELLAAVEAYRTVFVERDSLVSA